MSFGAQLHEYREEYLKISQKQMAEDLGTSASTISRYESDQRAFPIDQLQLMKETYNMSDELLLALVLGRPLKSVRTEKIMQTLDSTEQYTNSFLPKYADLVEAEPELRGIIALTADLEEPKRQLFLSSIRGLIELYARQLHD